MKRCWNLLGCLVLVACGANTTTISEIPATVLLPDSTHTPTLAATPTQRVAQTDAQGMPLLNICVDSPSALPEAAVATIESALQTGVAQHAHYSSMVEAVNGGEPPLVHAGCPSPPTIYDPTWSAGGKGSTYVTGAPHRVHQASPYFLFVFIVPQQDSMAAFGEVFPRRTGQELLCSGDNCATVNSAIYLSAQEFADPELLVPGLTWGLGLQ